MNDMQKENLFKMATDSVSATTRGHNLKIMKLRHRLKLREHTFTNRVVESWNSLPASVVNAQTINSFKNGVDKSLSKTCNKFSFGAGRLWQQQI